jgi:cytochrome c peroxidase
MRNRRVRKVMLLSVVAVGVLGGAALAADFNDMVRLGKNLFFDKISSPDSMACADCHNASVGFTGPIPGINRHGAVYRGAVPQRFGNRKPPTSAYATYSPVFYYDELLGEFVGGNFWDGRATGRHLGNPAADQAQAPFLNPVEQNNASKLAVLQQVKKSSYAYLWQQVWGEPLQVGTPAQIDLNYDRVGLALAAFEESSEVSPFSSKYDYYLEGMVELTPMEQWGLELFNGKANCAACHDSGRGPEGELPLFTDFTYDNIGTPKNPENPYYRMDRVYINGRPINPEGARWIDAGLGGFLLTTRWSSLALDNWGKQKIPTLRNVAKRPGVAFPKAYMHNGVFKSLEEVVHFYNTRDLGGWPPPEVPLNVSMELGDLGLTEDEEEAIVVFLETLSDGYAP